MLGQIYLNIRAEREKVAVGGRLPSPPPPGLMAAADGDTPDRGSGVDEAGLMITSASTPFRSRSRQRAARDAHSSRGENPREVVHRGKARPAPRCASGIIVRVADQNAWPVHPEQHSDWSGDTRCRLRQVSCRCR